jgi:centromere protein C
MTTVFAGIAFTSAMIKPQTANSTDSFLYQKVFSDEDFLAAGVLALPVNGEKPMKGTKDNTYVRTYLIISQA